MRILQYAGIALFALACCLPALEFRYSQSPNEGKWGVYVLAFGWCGVFANIYAWLANPLWIIGLIQVRRQRLWSAAIFGAAALAAAANTFAVIGLELPGDEANVTKMAIIGLLPGCYVWMASLATLPASALLAILRRQS